MREMNDSGIEWIGQIPKEWDILRLKYCFSGFTNGTSDTQLSSGESLYPVTRIETISSGEINLDKIGYVAFSKKQYLLKTGDILVSNINSIKYLGNCAVVRDGYRLYHGMNLLRVVPGDYIDNGYAYYLFKSNVFKFPMEKYCKPAINQASVSATTMKNFFIPFPDLVVQQQIANFLDTKCSEIDATAEDIQKEISLLEDYKKSVITEAVTKGLNPDAEMKDSGIEWIGQIPKHWEIPKITHILDYTHPYPIGDGDHGTIKAENYSEEGIPFIRVQNLGFATELIMNNVVYITEKQNNGIINSTLYPNDILFAKTGATIGKVGIMPENIKKANTTSHVGKITVSEEVVPKFIFYVLSSFIGYKQFWDIALMKSTRPELSIDEIKTLHVLLPKTIVEQQQIADYLDSKCSEIDSLIADKKRQFDILADYRKTLIYEYVTGKKEVPVNE